MAALRERDILLIEDEGAAEVIEAAERILALLLAEEGVSA